VDAAVRRLLVVLASARHPRSSLVPDEQRRGGEELW
jgi:hypothetical protein